MDIGLPQERKQSVALSEMIEYPFVFDHDGQRYMFAMAMVTERQELD
jgi:hypothetical protein